VDKKDLLKIVGLINLGEKESKKPFSQEDLRLLSIISGHVVIAIENAKLYEGLLEDKTQEVCIAVKLDTPLHFERVDVKMQGRSE